MTAAGFVTAAAAALVVVGSQRATVRAAPWRVVLLEPADPPPPPEYQEGLLQGVGGNGEGAAPQLGWRTIRAPGAMLAERAAQAVADGTDLVLTVSSAALAAALSAGPAVVFTDVADPTCTGARAPALLARWLPGLFGPQGPMVTGAYAVTDFGALLAIAAPVMPAEGLGAVFVATDLDSVALRDQLRVADQRVVSEPLDPAAPAAAVQALCTQRVRALVLLGDRSSDAVLGEVVAAAGACPMVIFGTRSAHAEAGALLTLARDERAAAVAAGRRAAALMRGEQPHLERFERVTATRLILNAQAAERAGVGLPMSLVEQADAVVGD